MRAAVCDRYGPPEVLRIEEVERPVPGDEHVLVRVHAAALTRTDCEVRRAHPFFSRLYFGLRRPKQRVLGSELAGEVEAVGAAVGAFAVGDQVFGSTGLGFRAHAEFIRLREGGALAHKPADLSFEEAAAICDGGIKALSSLRAAGLREGQRILVYGASGAIGTAAVQLAKHFGAHVTAVCDTRRLELARSLGADELIDYTQQDFAKNGETYDVVFDAVGKRSFRRCRRSLRRGGVYLATDMLHHFLLAILTRRLGSKRVVFAIPRLAREDVELFKELIETGRYRAVVDRCYPLEEIVEASRYVETGQKTGNVVLTVGRNGGS